MLDWLEWNSCFVDYKENISFFDSSVFPSSTMAIVTSSSFKIIIMHFDCDNYRFYKMKKDYHARLS
jgi:hypothetical protein